MAVIKSTAPAASSAKPFSMADIESYARTILLRARQEADQLLAVAQTEADSLKAQAKADGLAIGKREGLAQGKTEGTNQGKAQALSAETKNLTDLFATMKSLVEHLEQSRRELVDRADAEVLPLALAIARKVAKRLGQIDPRVVDANVREAVRLITTKHDLRLFIHPSQKQMLLETITKLKQQWPQMEHVLLEEDATISPGGCRVVTSGGEIDAELDSQLDRIARELIPDEEQPATPQES